MADSFKRAPESSLCELPVHIFVTILADGHQVIESVNSPASRYRVKMVDFHSRDSATFALTPHLFKIAFPYDPPEVPTITGGLVLAPFYPFTTAPK
jgi:hypothetical protein